MNQEKLKLDEAKTTQFLESLKALRAKSFLSSKKIKMKKINKLVLSNVANKDVFTLSWGGEYKINDELHYFVRTNLAEEGLTVSQATLNELFKGIEDDKSK